MALDPKLLADVHTIVTHENCPDGVASAILLHDALPSAEVLFFQYSSDALDKLAATPGMLFCDITPTAGRVQDFVDAGAIVLDHHKGARPIVEAFGANGVFADEKDDPGVSGAILAFREVWVPRVQQFPLYAENSWPFTRARAFASLAGIRDTWQTGASLWSEACDQAEALRFYPWSTWQAVSDPFVNGWRRLQELSSLGAILTAKKKIEVERAIATAWRFTTSKGTRVIVFQGVTLTSDAAEVLGDSVDLVIGFYYEVDVHAKLILSTRSHTTFDCSAFAKLFGGGGHTRAAGCSLAFVPDLPKGLVPSNPYRTVREMLGAFEEGRML